MVHIEIDGHAIEVPGDCNIIDAAGRLGIYVPHFCYHRKLSIAANCRMCLVQVEKAPKPLPACATPVTEGMKVYTHSPAAIQAQKGVMEFLLINHPLDCPICDQGGECQLQDLAVGYGGSSSRYHEPKRVVVSKDLGPLVAAEEMTRCIQCTRCVRFGQEIAGVKELGMVGRSEHAEIVAFVGKTVDSELSGNMIDICPVGALTSKPFRFTARSWELSRRRSVSPHCGLGSNLIVQVMLDRVLRVLPLENEQINECWLSDKDRFSYEALNSEQRLTRPMIKRDGRWEEVEWPLALEHVARGLRAVRDKHGAQAIGALATPYSTLEELYLLQKLMRGMGSGNVDFRLRQSDFSLDGRMAGAPWLGLEIADVGRLDRVLVVGSQLRKDHPLLAQRLRQAAKKGAQVSVIHALDDDQLIKLHQKLVVPPVEMANALGQVLKAARQLGAAQLVDDIGAALDSVSVSPAAQRIAESLMSGGPRAVLLGNMAQHHPQGSILHQLGLALAESCGAKFGFLGEAANSVGGYIAGAVPFGTPAGLNAAQMLAHPLEAYLLLNAEAELDTQDPQRAMAAMRGAGFVVALSAFRHRASEYADALLPVAPFTETAGCFINTAGRLQAFNGVVRPLGEARPAWKVLRVLGNLLGAPGFEFASAEQVRAELLGTTDLAARLSNAVAGNRQIGTLAAPAVAGVQRIADVPIYFADALVRRARSLQQTADAAVPVASMSGTLLVRLGLRHGDRVLASAASGEAVLEVKRDDRIPAGCVRIPAAHPLTSPLASMFGEVQLARVAAEDRVRA
ncbi:MAG TPA: NADH-quinone oxidoreductase subunit NuoG [Burkholderiales bacterium]|nr:NADH-quinone oxidoreductase subunit NuoG [Burkholderiales bacterium]